MLKNFFLAFFPFLFFTIEGKSMEPTLKSGQRVLVVRFVEIKKGDIIICTDPRDGRILVKRVRTVNAIVNLTAPLSLSENTQPSELKTERQGRKLPIMSDKRYFVVGDNKKASTDSRNFGWIFQKNIVGKVIVAL